MASKLEGMASTIAVCNKIEADIKQQNAALAYLERRYDGPAHASGGKVVGRLAMAVRPMDSPSTE